MEERRPGEFGQRIRRQSAGARAFIDAIVEGRPMTPDLSGGVMAQQVIDAALRSHRAGDWVAVTE